MTTAVPLWKLAIPRPDRLPRARRAVEVTVVAPQTPNALRDIGAIARATAFRLTGVTPLDRGWRCRFELTAEVGVVGDGQVFELLRRIGAVYPWSSVDKQLVAWPNQWQGAPDMTGAAAAAAE